MYEKRMEHLRHSVCKSRDHEHLLANFDSELVDEIDRQAHHGGLNTDRDCENSSPSIYLSWLARGFGFLKNDLTSLGHVCSCPSSMCVDGQLDLTAAIARPSQAEMTLSRIYEPTLCFVFVENILLMSNVRERLVSPIVRRKSIWLATNA
jgi:hypothetical protein